MTQSELTQTLHGIDKMNESFDLHQLPTTDSSKLQETSDQFLTKMRVRSGSISKCNLPQDANSTDLELIRKEPNDEAPCAQVANSDDVEEMLVKGGSPNHTDSVKVQIIDEPFQSGAHSNTCATLSTKVTTSPNGSLIEYISSNTSPNLKAAANEKLAESKKGPQVALLSLTQQASVYSLISTESLNN